jgi:HlyD family secretion protein
MKSLVRRILLFGFVAAVAGAIILGLRPAAVEADLAKVVRGEIRETVDQDGKTRLRERYTLSAPLAGRLLRIELDPGDEVTAGETLVASIEPRDPELLDARAVLQAEANVKAAEARLERTTPLLDEAAANLEFAEADLNRAQQARRQSPNSVTTNELENKEMLRRSRAALVRAAEHAHEVAKFELAQAQAALLRSRPTDAGETDGNGDEPAPYPQQAPQPHFEIQAPINGRVLRVFRESSGVVQAGEPLLEIGDPLDLEVEIDVLSRDAVKVKPGAPVLLEEWGGDRALNGEVRLVEPSGFTKISTLGVEEQRVNVIVDLVDPPQKRETLGDGFRVEARIVIAEADDVLKVPTSALFRVGDEWAVFRVEEGVARQRTVKLGLENGLEAEVQEGLAEGDEVVTHPGDNVVDGRAVKAR